MLSVWTDFGCSDVAMQHCSRAVNLGICLHTTIMKTFLVGLWRLVILSEMMLEVVMDLDMEVDKMVQSGG